MQYRVHRADTLLLLMHDLSHLELTACVHVGCLLFRSTEGRVKSVKFKSGLFPGFQFSQLSTYLGVYTCCMLCMRRVLDSTLVSSVGNNVLKYAVKIEGKYSVWGGSQNFLRLRRALAAGGGVKI